MVYILLLSIWIFFIVLHHQTFSMIIVSLWCPPPFLGHSFYLNIVGRNSSFKSLTKFREDWTCTLHSGTILFHVVWEHISLNFLEFIGFENVSRLGKCWAFYVYFFSAYEDKMIWYFVIFLANVRFCKIIGENRYSNMCCIIMKKVWK